MFLHLDNDRIGRLAIKSNFYSPSETISDKRYAKTRKRLQRSALQQVNGNYKARKRTKKNMSSS